MLYLIRHGETEWNAEYRLQGQTETRLTENGRAQARAAAKACRDIPFDLCYCSTLGRAGETAALLLEGRDVPILADERLKEIGFGAFEGTVWASRHPELPIYPFFKTPEKYIAEQGAEPLEAVFRRLSSFRDECLTPALAAGKNVLVVSHGAALCALIGLYRHTALKDFWSNFLKNCQLTVIETGLPGADIAP